MKHQLVPLPMTSRQAGALVSASAIAAVIPELYSAEEKRRRKLQVLALLREACPAPKVTQ